ARRTGRPSARAWASPWSHPHRRGARPAQHHVPAVPERDTLDAMLEIEIGYQELAPGLGHALEDRIDGQQGIAGEEHLRDEPLRVRVAEEREVDVRRSPPEGVVLPWIRAGLDRHDPVATLFVREHLSLTKEVRIERGFVVVHGMRIFAGRVGLPHFDERPPYRRAVLAEK